MADCKLYTGELRGKKCRLCQERLRCGDIVYQWGEHLFEIGCLVQYTTRDRDPPSDYQIPGTDWQAP